MSKEHMNVDQNTLVDAWKKQLPEYLNPGDSAEVLADMANPKDCGFISTRRAIKCIPLIFHAPTWIRARLT